MSKTASITDVLACFGDIFKLSRRHKCNISITLINRACALRQRRCCCVEDEGLRRIEREVLKVHIIDENTCASYLAHVLKGV